MRILENCSSETDKSANRRFLGSSWKLVISLIIGFLLGVVVGARYVASLTTAQVYLGTLLPPHSVNWNRNDFDKITFDMDREAVWDVLKLERCDILCGSGMKYLMEQVESGHPQKDAPTSFKSSDVVEIWKIPKRRNGLTEFLFLGFNASDRVCLKGIDEFIMGQKCTRL